jgi:hypothetical protein
MIGDARLAGEMAERMLEEGVYVIGVLLSCFNLQPARDVGAWTRAWQC